MKKLAIYITVAIVGFSCENAEPGQGQPVSRKADNGVHADSAEFDSFGFRIDTLKVKKHRIKKNESLYLILDKFGISPPRIHSITQKAGEVIDFKKLKPGQQYYTYGVEQIERLVWQPSPVEYIVFELRDSIDVYRSEKRITTESVTASAVITNSLYETMTGYDMNPLLAYKLSDVYAWEIDFFSLRKGDWFKVLYEKKFIGGELYDIGEILAAKFVHRGETYRAFKFRDDSITGYFDEEGNSIQKALLKAPFKYGQRISSGFSHSRFHPVLKRRVPHRGIDYAAPHGTPVLSVGDGTVIEAGHKGSSGNMVKVRHNSTYETAYLHLNGFAEGIHNGAKVRQGQVIGYVGNTGRVTGTHLDYRLYKNGRPVNPLQIALPASRSIPEGSMGAFKQVKKYWTDKLEKESDPRKESLAVNND